jgi:hypothetical protein
VTAALRMVSISDAVGQRAYAVGIEFAYCA